MTVATAVPPATRLQIVADCERLCLDYCFFADAGRMDEWAELFAEDAELHLFGQVHAGRPAIRTSVGAGGGGTMTTVHSISNVRIDVTGEATASGTAYVTVYTADKSQPAPDLVTPMLVGIYRDDYRLTAAGWRIARRAFEPLVMRGR